MDDLRQLLADAFAAELAEHLAAIRAGLAQAEAGGAPDLRDIFRRAHSLKGAARAVDRPDIEEVAHTLESLLADVEQGARPLRAVAEPARALVDAIEDLAAASRDAARDVAGGAAAAKAEPVAATEADAPETIRIAARQIEQLGEAVRALRGDLEARALIASDLRGTRAEIEAIRAACLMPGARPAAIAARLTRLLASSGAIAGRRIAADGQVERSAAMLGREAERILLAPAAILADGQERMMRGLAAEAGKPAVLVVRCDPVEADRRVLQALRDPLTHILRNAIGHGIEPPAGRVRAGKPERATVTLELRERAGQLLLAVEDDGPGPDVAAILAAARARGVAIGDAPSEAEALALVFEHGVSTRTEVDRLSGRGVGLAVVADTAQRLDGGARMLRSAAGGTRIELVVPLTLTRRTVLLVEAAGQSFAIPTTGAGRALRFAAAQIVHHQGMPMLPDPRSGEPDGEGAHGDRLLPLVSLAALLGLAASPAGERIEAFALHAGGRTWVVAVDALVDVRLLTPGDAGEIAADVPLVSGTVPIGEGGVALMLSPERLAERILRGGTALAALPAAPTPRRQRTILVVDDSITTRTLERGILEGHGYRVLTSVDGVDGLAALREGAGTIDLVIADVEMPRMDGFGLVAAIRNDPAVADIPVIMMTSRNSPEDIQRGLELGADAYVTKQEFEQGSLLATVGRLI